ncbi:MAG: site-specific DNA-methyltransferase [Ruminococcus sp.]|nr:site-specific DNA-methyltransferase [Ruminococcus sp.]
MMKENYLIHADNLIGMQWLLDNGYEGKIDLVYIDPPFATGGTFGIDNTGRVATISKSNDGIVAYEDTLKGEDFITWLKLRVVLIHKLLSQRGSLYLHIDYKIGHYVKIMLDEVFGIDNFRNDITRIKCNPKGFNRVGYGNIKDMILFYSKESNPIWNDVQIECAPEDIEKRYNKIDSKGRRYTTVPIHAPGETKNGNTSQCFRGVYPPKGRHWRSSVQELERLDDLGLIEWSANGNPRKINYADEHLTKKQQDIWEYKDPAYPIYPTEKNLDMLKYIINNSSEEGSIVMDCFCGSGSTLYAAKACGRRWIGIDRSEVAIKVTRERMGESSIFSEDSYTLLKLI